MTFDLGEYDYHEKSEVKDGELKLSWRMDPEESWSDWTISVDIKQSVKADDNLIADINIDYGIVEDKLDLHRDYHVHKAQLSVGRNKSEYFSRLFRNESMTEANDATSRISLDKSAAMAFPAFLDFMYSDAEDIKATSDNSVALRFLSQYFGVRELFERVNDFIQHDLHFSNAHIYVMEAKRYHDDKVLTHAIKVCAQNFQVIGGKLSAKLPAKLFKDIICSPDLRCESKALSLCVAHICETQPSSIDSEMLSALTDFRIMPSVDSSIALYLLRLSVQNNLDSLNISGDKWSLTKRCINAASIGWKDAIHEMQQDLPSNIRIELMSCSLREAKKELIKEKLISQENQRKVRKAIEERDASLMDALTNMFQSRNDVGDKRRVLALVRGKISALEELILESSEAYAEMLQIIHETTSVIDTHLSETPIVGLRPRADPNLV